MYKINYKTGDRFVRVVPDHKNVFNIFKYDEVLGKEMLDGQNCITTTVSLMFES
jgi:hypothetical protein